MKIREGFVSNSSSSNFIVDNTMRYVATTMLDIVIKEWSEWEEGSSKKEIADSKKASRRRRANLKKALRLPAVMSGEIGVTFPSTNYDTYIIDRNRCYVQTSRNHDWGELDGRGQDYGDDLNPEIAEATEDAFFYDLDNGTIHTTIQYDEHIDIQRCSHCNRDSYGHYWDQAGNKLCTNCAKIIVPVKPVVKTFHSPISDIEID